MPERDKNSQEGPDVRGSLIKISVGDDIIFVDPNQCKPQVEHAKKLKQQRRKSKNPRPQEWISEEYSECKVADYKPFNFVGGENVRCGLYVSRCLFDYPGYYSLAVRNSSYRRPYTQELEDKIIEDTSQSYVQGLTLLGGEPFSDTWVCLELIDRVHKEFGRARDIWSWLGYTWDEFQKETPNRKEMFSKANILIDGRFMDDLKDLTLQFRGSGSQRIIDVQRSLKAKKVVVWDKLVR